MNDEKMTPEEIQLARALRLGVISQQHRVGNITEAQARELLRGPLTPGDNSTIIDDSNQLITDESIERAAYERGFREGAEQMRNVFWEEAMRLNWSPSATARIKTMPLPEPQP